MLSTVASRGTLQPNPAVNRIVLGAASPASAAGYLARGASEKHKWQ